MLGAAVGVVIIMFCRFCLENVKFERMIHRLIHSPHFCEAPQANAVRRQLTCGVKRFSHIPIWRLTE